MIEFEPAETLKVGDTISFPGREGLWGRMLRRLGLRRGPVKPWIGVVTAEGK